MKEKQSTIAPHNQRLIPAAVVLNVARTNTDEGERHKINEVQGYYCEVVVSLDLRNTGATATYTIELLDNSFETTLHSRTVTLVQNNWTTVELRGILKRIDKAAELQVTLSATVASMNYRFELQRRPQ